MPNSNICDAGTKEIIDERRKGKRLSVEDWRWRKSVALQQRRHRLDLGPAKPRRVVWSSASDTPLAEEKEAYRLRLAASAFERTVMLSEPRYLYSVDQQAEDGFTGAMSIGVVQVGTHAASRAARLVVA